MYDRKRKESFLELPFRIIALLHYHRLILFLCYACITKVNVAEWRHSKQELPVKHINYSNAVSPLRHSQPMMCTSYVVHCTMKVLNVLNRLNWNVE